MKTWLIKYEDTNTQEVKYDFELDFGKVPCPSKYPYEIRRRVAIVTTVYVRDKQGMISEQLERIIKVLPNNENVLCILAQDQAESNSENKQSTGLV